MQRGEKGDSEDNGARSKEKSVLLSVEIRSEGASRAGCWQLRLSGARRGGEAWGPGPVVTTVGREERSSCGREGEDAPGRD